MAERDWMDRIMVAEHEACHAVVAQKLGLPVAWVTIDPGCDEGLNFDAAVKIPDELIDRDDPDTLKKICLAMATPYHFLTHHNDVIGHYAALENMLALEIAGMAGIDTEDFDSETYHLFTDNEAEIIALAQRLEAEGTITFENVGV